MYALTLSPDGRHLYAAQWYPGPDWLPKPVARITVIDTETRAVVRQLTEPDHPCGIVRFHPDGKTAYVYRPHPLGLDTVHRVEIATWGVLGVLDPNIGQVQAAHLSPDGWLLATTHRQTWIGKPRHGEAAVTTLWDAVTLAKVRELTPVDAPGTMVGAFAPDGTALAANLAHPPGDRPGNRSLVVAEFDPATGQEVRRTTLPPAADGSATSAAMDYTPDGSQLFIAGGTMTQVAATNRWHMSGRAWRWDRRRAEAVPLAAHDDGDYYRTMALSPDGRRLYLGGRSQTLVNHPRLSPNTHPVPRSRVQAWRTDARNRIEWAADGELFGVTALCPLADGKRVAVADPDGVWLFDAADGHRLGRLLELHPD